MYDPGLGRFVGIDPICEKFYHVTTYNYAENSPIANIDWWGLQAVFFQKGLEKNESFQNSYKAQRKTSLGKEFSNKLNSQDKYNVLYFTFNYRWCDGSLTEIADLESFNSKSRYNGELAELSSDDVKDALEEGKPILLIGVKNKPNSEEGVLAESKILNHEEGAHGIDYLDNGVNDKNSNEDHDEYYGRNDSKEGISPNDSDASENSPAKINWDQLKVIVKKMFYKPPGKFDDIDKQY